MPNSHQTPRTVNRRTVLGGALASSAALAVGAGLGRPAVGRAQENITLSILTHWGTQEQKDAMDAILAQYTEANPNVTVVHETVAFAELVTRITTGQLGGDAPDLYHFYNLWLPEFATSELLAAPPDAAVTDITASYGEGSVGGATYNDQLWGYPTEVNTFQLLSNKAMLDEAGVTPPATVEEFRAAAEALTKREGDTVTQAGMLFFHSWDTGVVHPFTSLLYSAGGSYVAEDNSAVQFNQQSGIDILQMQVEMIEAGHAMTGILEDNDFLTGQAAMTIMANFWGADLRAGMTGGIENVVVSPIPTSGENTSSAVQYQWICGVSAASQQQEAAWALASWLNSPLDGGSSPMGNFLTSALNAIPGRATDQEAHADLLSDPFIAPFIEAFQTSRSEAIIPGAQEIKTTLQTQIEAAWFGEKAAADALNEAAAEADAILAEQAG
jgi:multiple sugar transport system substrate-binding protein